MKTISFVTPQTYRRRRDTVRAVRWDGLSLEPVAELLVGVPFTVTWQETVGARMIRIGPEKTMTTPGGSVLILENNLTPGDWLVCYQGVAKVMNHKDFSETFEPTGAGE